MTTTEKRQFIRSLTKSISKELCAKAAKMPRAWDGHQLREFLFEKFQAERTTIMRKPRSKARRDFSADVYNLNLW